MKEEKLYRGYKIRLFPTPEQEELMRKHSHATRYVWNYMLSLQKKRHDAKSKYLSSIDMCKEITLMKRECEFSFLKEVSVHSLQYTCRDLDNAYKMFFNKKSGKPQFKKRKDGNFSFPVRTDKNATYFVSEEILQIPKIII